MQFRFNAGDSVCQFIFYSGTKDCSDLSDQCSKYLQVSSCTNQVVAQQCQASCGLCENQCVDRESTCNILAGTGYCNNKLIADTCPKSCGFCGQAGEVIYRITEIFIFIVLF